ATAPSSLPPTSPPPSIPSTVTENRLLMCVPPLDWRPPQPARSSARAALGGWPAAPVRPGLASSPARRAAPPYFGGRVAADRGAPRGREPTRRSTPDAGPRRAPARGQGRRTAPPRTCARAGTLPRTAGARVRASPETRADRIPVDRPAAGHRVDGRAGHRHAACLVPSVLCPFVECQRVACRTARAPSGLVAVHPLVACCEELLEGLAIVGKARGARADRQ